MSQPVNNPAFKSALQLSPRRNSSEAQDIPGLVAEQLTHFGIDSGSDLGKALAKAASHIYQCQDGIDSLWRYTQLQMHDLDAPDRIAMFNAKKFLSFQLAKVLDTLQNPFRASYQNLGYSQSTLTAKSAYPIFDNVTAIFSATPIIARTATYIYACAEWIADAFEGRELMLEIYSRLLNPTSISLANHIVDLEAGPYANEYLAWNFNSGMAAIDATLSHVLGYEDIIIVGQNIYGGAHQLIHDWFSKPSNLNVAVEVFAGETSDLETAIRSVQKQYSERLTRGRKIYLYIESPCNPHGYVLDVPALSKIAHANNIRVVLDATVGTPFLHQPLQRENLEERPDFVIHSYTKDLSGTGSVIAGGVIGRNADMFIPKGDSGWENTLFWNVYYVKGAFLTADMAYEVLQGTRTLEMRMLKKCINTQILAEFLHTHPDISVNCNCLPSDPNYSLAQQNLFLGMPAGLFTVDLPKVPKDAFQRFFDALEPTFGHMISLGQTNTIVSCPGLTTHSELSAEQQKQAGIYPTTIRMAVGDENPKDLIKHLVYAARLCLEPVLPDFVDRFPSEADTDALIRRIYVGTHSRYVDALLAG